MNRYATLDQALRELSQDDSVTASADDTKKVVWDALAFASERIDQLTADEFAPRIDIRYFDARGQHILSTATMDIVAGQPTNHRSSLLAITSVTIGGEDTALATTAYQSNPRGTTPIRKLTLLDGDSWLTYGTTWEGAHAIAGVWGNRTRYSTEGWVDSGDTVENNPLAADGVTINVNDADALSGAYALPRFQAGQLLRIGATGSDYRLVQSVIGASTNTLTVTNNANGGTSASVAQNTAIYIWQPELAIQRAAIVWVKHLFARRGVTTSSTYDGATGVAMRFPPDAPEEVMNILTEAGYLQNKRGWRAV